MGTYAKIILGLSQLFMVAACTTSFHGSFVASTFIDDEHIEMKSQRLPVEGQSCQTKVLYFFPTGPPPSTAAAIQSAKDQYEGTKYLSDVSIDDKTKWKIGYSIQCITVEAFAHR